jgi:hypothetical protein
MIRPYTAGGAPPISYLFLSYHTDGMWIFGSIDSNARYVYESKDYESPLMTLSITVGVMNDVDRA